MPKVVALDFETANYPRNSAIALGLSVLEDGVFKETKSWYFRPPGKSIYIREDFIAIHGIRPADLRDKPQFDGVWNEIRSYLEDVDLLIAHNAAFDRSVLYSVAEYYDISLPDYSWQCTVNIARRTWPHLFNHKLPTVSAHLGIQLKHHDPASDAEACSKIFIAAAAGVEPSVAYSDNDNVTAISVEAEAVLAQYRLGVRYYNGHDVMQSYDKALHWLRKAAEQGHIKAQTHLGLMYSRGEGVAQDDVEAPCGTNAQNLKRDANTTLKTPRNKLQ
jgi:DNA polymerase-3 subunit epsilon